MTFLRSYLSLCALLIILYTLAVLITHGLTLFHVFFGAILAVDWAGQFNLDFAIYLSLSAIWIAWRHGFTARGCAFAAFAGVLGAVVFLPYLLVQLAQVQGNVNRLLMGVHAKLPEASAQNRPATGQIPPA